MKWSILLLVIMLSFVTAVQEKYYIDTYAYSGPGFEMTEWETDASVSLSNLGHLKIMTSYENFYTIYDYEDLITLTFKYCKLLTEESPFNKFNIKVSFQNKFCTLKLAVNEFRQLARDPSPIKFKRSIDFVGNINRFLWGTMDSNDRERINSELDTIQKQQLMSSEKLKGTIIALNGSISVIADSIDTITENLHNNEIVLQKYMKYTTEALDDIQLQIHFDGIYNNLVQYTERIRNEFKFAPRQDYLFAKIESKYGVEKKALYSAIPSKFDYSLITSGTKIIHRLKIWHKPAGVYDYYQLLSVPIDTGKYFESITIRHEYVGISRSFDTEKYLRAYVRTHNKCLLGEDKNTYCFSANDIDEYEVYNYQMECEDAIILNKPKVVADRCTTTKSYSETVNLNRNTFIVACKTRSGQCNVKISYNADTAAESGYHLAPIQLFPVTKLILNGSTIATIQETGKVIRSFENIASPIYVQSKIPLSFNIAKLISDREMERDIIKDVYTTESIKNIYSTFNITNFKEIIKNNSEIISDTYNELDNDMMKIVKTLLQTRVINYCDSNTLNCITIGGGIIVFVLGILAASVYCCVKCNCCCGKKSGEATTINIETASPPVSPPPSPPSSPTSPPSSPNPFSKAMFPSVSMQQELPLVPLLPRMPLSSEIQSHFEKQAIEKIKQRAALLNTSATKTSFFTPLVYNPRK